MKNYCQKFVCKFIKIVVNFLIELVICDAATGKRSRGPDLYLLLYMSKSQTRISKIQKTKPVRE